MITPDFEKIAYNIIHKNISIKEGEGVFIDSRDDNLFFAELIAVECKKIGADPLIINSSDNYFYNFLTQTPIKYLNKLSKAAQGALSKCTAIISTYSDRKDPLRFKDLNSQQLKGIRNWSMVRWNRLQKEDCRWVGIGFPTEEQAKMYNTDFDKFYNTFWQAVDIDYDKLSKNIKKVKKMLLGKKTVNIKSEKGTNININIFGQEKIGCDDGIISKEDIKEGFRLLNLPSGEVFLAPSPNGTNGKVIFDFAFKDGKEFLDLEVEFRQGKCFPISARKGLRDFKEIMKSSTGKKDIIAELGIGLNPVIKDVVGYLLTDEKVMGTIHIAIGDNLNMGGNNKSNIHWDMIVKNPTVKIDGKPLIINGKFVEIF